MDVLDVLALLTGGVRGRVGPVGAVGQGGEDLTKNLEDLLFAHNVLLMENLGVFVESPGSGHALGN